MTVKRHHPAEKASTGITAIKYFFPNITYKRPQTQYTPKPNAKMSAQNVSPSTTASHSPRQPRSRPSSLGSSLVQKKKKVVAISSKHQNRVEDRRICSLAASIYGINNLSIRDPAVILTCWPRLVAGRASRPREMFQCRTLVLDDREETVGGRGAIMKRLKGLDLFFAPKRLEVFPSDCFSRDE